MKAVNILNFRNVSLPKTLPHIKIMFRFTPFNSGMSLLHEFFAEHGTSPCT